jgi:hypothetical protein
VNASVRLAGAKLAQARCLEFDAVTPTLTTSVARQPSKPSHYCRVYISVSSHTAHYKPRRSSSIMVRGLQR